MTGERQNLVSSAPTGEHSPAPTPARAFYGFTLYLTSIFLFLVYCTWAYLPGSLLNSFGFTYWPQKHWALAVPALFIVGFFSFALIVYPAINLTLVPTLDDPRTLTPCRTEQQRNVTGDGIPEFEDLDISEVCRTLYSGKGEQ